MLSSVRIKDFALIGDLTLEFGPHLNALTGETGAGKSIIVDAIGLLVGERAATGSIRSGSKSAYIEGIFTLEVEPGIAEALAEAGIELEDDTLIVSREVTPTRSVVRLNGRAVPLRTLQKITPGLIDIQGQSEQQSLSQPARQLHFVDAYGGLLGQAAELREKVREFRSLEREIAELREHSRNRAREIDLLRFQVEEIESTELEPAEEVAIRAERTILMNSRRLVELAAAAARALSDEDGASTGAADLAGEALERLQEVADLDETVKPALERLGAATEVLGELASEMSSYAESVADDPGRLEEIELRPGSAGKPEAQLWRVDRGGGRVRTGGEGPAVRAGERRRARGGSGRNFGRYQGVTGRARRGAIGKTAGGGGWPGECGGDQLA